VAQIVIFMALASIVLGALGAIGQQNLKRLLAYSSINNIGFILIGLAVATADGGERDVGVSVHLCRHDARQLPVALLMLRGAMARRSKPSPISVGLRVTRPRLRGRCCSLCSASPAFRRCSASGQVRGVSGGHEADLVASRGRDRRKR
jgi:hypothetical protein